MNIIGSLRSFWYGEDSDAAQIDPIPANQTNVPSRPRSREPMPSTRSETTSSSTSALRAGYPKSKKGAERWLQHNDPMAQDPIELSDDEESPRIQPTRTSRSQVTRHSDPHPPRRDTTRANSRHTRSNTDAQGGRVPDNFKTPTDAVIVAIPGASAGGNTMSKHKPSGFLKPMNTLDNKAAPARGSKGLFIHHNIHKTPPKASKTSTATQSKQVRTLSRTRSPEPPRKKVRMNNESPDILHEQGSRSIKLELAPTNNSIEHVPFTPEKPTRGLPDRTRREPLSDRHGPTHTAQTTKIPALWRTTMHTNRYARDITQSDNRVMSDEDDNNFIKAATNERKRRKRLDDDIEEIGHAEVPKSSMRKVTTTSRHFSQSQPESPTNRLNELDEILPQKILQPHAAGAPSPDAIQEESSAEDDSSVMRKHKTPAIDNRPRTVTPRSAVFQQTPPHTVLFRPNRMLFGRAPADVSLYVLEVNKITRTFSIRYGSNLLGDEPLLPHTPVDRILRIIHGVEGPKVKIETCKINIVDHGILLELKTHKRVFDLVTLLTRLGNVKVLCKDDEWLDRVFDKFDNEQHRAREQGYATVSPHFDEPRSGTHSRRRDEPSSVNDPYIGAHGFTRTSRSQVSASTTQRRQRTLEEDFNGWETYEDPAPAPSNTNGTSTRSRPARSTVVRTSPKPLPYSQSGKLGERWKTPLIYPRTGKKRTSVDFDDLSRLDDDEFLNDNLIAFFVRYIEHYLEQEQLEIWKKSYFFNSYFYEKLRQNPKDKKNINYEGVKKWTDKIDLFSRDFVVVPVNENLHWYVAIICNLSWFKKSEEERDAIEREEVGRDSVVAETDVTMENTNETQQSLQELTLEDRDMQGDILVSESVPESSGKSTGSTKKKGMKRKSERPLVGFDPNKPAIVTLDSLGVPRYTTASALKQYLAQEAKERLGKDIDLKDIQGLSAKKIPMQGNFSDCGLFVCAYLERFATDPTAFKKQELERIPQQWPELHSHELRSRMRDLILTLHDQQENKVPDQDLPSVGEILLPPVTPSRPLLNGASVEDENEDKTMYDLPSSPVAPHKRLIRGQKRDGFQEQPSDSKAELNRSHTSLPVQNGHTDLKSLRARTAKILGSPFHSFTVPDSDEEREAHRRLTAKDDPKEMAKWMREERSPESSQHVRSDSVSTEFLNGDNGIRSYELPEQKLRGTDYEDDDEMLIS